MDTDERSALQRGAAICYRRARYSYENGQLAWAARHQRAARLLAGWARGER